MPAPYPVARITSRAPGSLPACQVPSKYTHARARLPLASSLHDATHSGTRYHLLTTTA